MGEIRSTLDIIMEKTKGLTLSDEERAALKQKEAEDKARGLLQKRLDRLVSTDQLTAELAAMDVQEAGTVRRLLQHGVCERLDLESDEGIFLEILEGALSVPAEPVRHLLQRFRAVLEEKRREREEALLEDLRKRGISGSAVVANVRADEEWKAAKASLHAQLRQELARQEPETP